MAILYLSVSRNPDGVQLSSSRRFAVLTPASALPFDWGLYAEDSLWVTFQFWRNDYVSAAMNSGPPSDDKILGIPLSMNKVRRHTMRPLTPAFGVPEAARVMSSQPKSLSTVMR